MLKVASQAEINVPLLGKIQFLEAEKKYMNENLKRVGFFQVKQLSHFLFCLRRENS